MTRRKFDEVFGGPPRKPESKLGQREMDLARSIQEVTEEVMLRLARTLHHETGVENLCLAGGVALNCVGNGRILREGPFKGLWIQPAAGDAGGALGAALARLASVTRISQELRTEAGQDEGELSGASLYRMKRLKRFSKRRRAPYVRLDDEQLCSIEWPRILPQERSWAGCKAAWSLGHDRSAGEAFWGCAQYENAVRHEPQDQVSRVV